MGVTRLTVKCTTRSERRLMGELCLLIGGTLKFLSLLVLEINTFFFRKDKFRTILKVIIGSFIIRMLWVINLGLRVKLKGDNSVLVLLNYIFSGISSNKQNEKRILSLWNMLY